MKSTHHCHSSGSLAGNSRFNHQLVTDAVWHSATCEQSSEVPLDSQSSEVPLDSQSLDAPPHSTQQSLCGHKVSPYSSTSMIRPFCHGQKTISAVQLNQQSAHLELSSRISFGISCTIPLLWGNILLEYQRSQSAEETRRVLDKALARLRNHLRMQRENHLNDCFKQLDEMFELLELIFSNEEIESALSFTDAKGHICLVVTLKGGRTYTLHQGQSIAVLDASSYVHSRRSIPKLRK